MLSKKVEFEEIIYDIGQLKTVLNEMIFPFPIELKTNVKPKTIIGYAGELKIPIYC